MMKWKRKKQSWRLFAFKALSVMVLLFVAAEAFSARYRIAYDPQKVKCLPNYSVYLLDTWDTSRERGGLYFFDARGFEPIFQDGTRLVKILSALPGDHVQVSHDGVFVNSSNLAKGLALADKLGSDPKDFLVSGTLQEGNYWFLGEHELSFDSRYWGAVDNDQILGRAYPIY
ncbi:S26 family signal peptidase [Pseudovibrio sp. Ad37]|uniref:S26 family signal peptidase n=1 Tax=Pseudovibrio sp. Ad37 TaxID=989422 RepID=UPI0007B1D01A|nr:S26 family signal peptidase [Pseudovibrio sp. Ad37]KZL22683.1 Peptidase S26 [Pseudovibrio sp. Ad37]